MFDCEIQRDCLAGIQARKEQAARGRFHDGYPSLAQRVCQFKRTRQGASGKDFITHYVRYRDLPVELAQQIERASRGETNQGTGIRYDDSVRHASATSASAFTVSAVPETTGMPSRDTC